MGLPGTAVRALPEEKGPLILCVSVCDNKVAALAHSFSGQYLHLLEKEDGGGILPSLPWKSLMVVAPLCFIRY